MHGEDRINRSSRLERQVLAMPLQTRGIRGVTVVRLSGPLDPAAAHGLQATISELVVQGARWFVIDLSKVEGISGTGVSALLALRRRVESHTGGLTLCGLSEDMRRVFDFLQTTNRFATARSILAAVRNLKKAQEIKELADVVARLLTASEARSTVNEGVNR